MRRMWSLAALIAAVLAVSTLRGQGSGRIDGIVQERGGQPLAAVRVQLKAEGTFRDRQTTTDMTGAFSFEGLPAGHYDVVASVPAFSEARQTVTLSDRARVALTIEMDRIQIKNEPEVLKSAAPAVTEMPASRARMSTDAGLNIVVPPWFPRPRIVEPNTEAYDHINEYRWTEVARSPLSTFSIDVDTASYANVRRFLHSGTRPPKDAIRIEELINYFSYDYTEPRGADPFSITTGLAPSPWHKGYQLALVGLQARHLPSDGMPPRNLVFLIDVSGSMMTPNKLPLVKASLSMLARNLTARDHVSIVVYAGAAGLVLPPTRGDDRAAITDALQRLEAGGSTNGADGLRLAYRTARTHFARGGVNRVILATDGDFNVGVTSRDELLQLVESERQSGTALSVLGFGMGNLKDSTMEQLADKGNGNYAYIDDLSEARKVLVEEAGGTLVTVAKDVKLQVEFNPAAVTAYRLIGYENRALDDRDFNDDRKDAGDLGAGQSVTALYEIVPVGQPVEGPAVDRLRYQPVPVAPPREKSDETMWVKVRYKRPEASESTLMTTAVAAKASMTPELGFASAVASFGMLLRDSEFKGTATFAAARRLAEIYRGPDALGHRAEFARLIDLAEGLMEP